MIRISHYLPSAQFSLIVGAITVSGGLVFAAQYVTGPHEPATLAVAPTDQTQPSANPDWKQALVDIQAQSPGASLTQAPNPTAVSDLLSAAKTNNVTDTVGRTLLINLSAAKSQGLGSDIPTQNTLISQALAQIDPGRGTPAYTSASLTLSDDTQDAQKAYGNGVMAVVKSFPEASYSNTLLTMGNAIDSADSTKLAALSGIQAQYRAATAALVALPVPPTLAPLHLQIVNDLAAISKTFDDMRTVIADPLRGLAGLQTYETLTNELSRVFTNIAQDFPKNGILFNKDEPGSAWAQLLSQP